jgi:imidazolonepropionase-like amidohydrolase
VRVMFRTGIVSIAAGLALAQAAAAQPPTPAAPIRDVLYRNATLIDGTGAPERKGVSVLVEGERIKAVGDAASLQPPAGAVVIDASGLYVLPGLINTHEHLATPPNRPFAEAELRKDLYGGVTTLRDMADDLRQVADLSRAARVGEIPGPDIYYAALMAGPEFFEDPRTRAVAKGADAGPGHVPWMQEISHDTDLVLAVAQARGTGATAIKIYADLPADLVAAITREAHRQGIQVWTHWAVFPAAPAEVVDAGVDTVSHACMGAYQASDAMPHAYHNRAPVQAEKFAHGDNPAVEAVLQDMKTRGTILDATLRVYVELAQSYAEHPKGPPPYCMPDLAERLTAEAHRDGVEVSTGTDGFSAASDPWPALQDELELLQDKAGMTPSEVIRSATLVGAMTMHKDGETGTIAPGKLANLVFTKDDPSKDVRALRTIVLTVKRGAQYWRKDYTPSPNERRGEP